MEMKIQTIMLMALQRYLEAGAGTIEWTECLEWATNLYDEGINYLTLPLN